MVVYGLEHLIGNQYVPDQSFWRAAPYYSVITMIGLGVAASIILGMARRRLIALTVLSSTGIWTLVFLAGSLRANVINTLAGSSLVLVLVLTGFAARSAVRRSREPVGDQGSLRQTT